MVKALGSIVFCECFWEMPRKEDPVFGKTWPGGGANLM